MSAPTVNVGAPRRVVAGYVRWVTRVAWVLSVVAACLTLLISFMLIADLISRNVFGHSLNAVFETVRASIVAIVFLALAYAESSETHIRIEVLTERLRGRALAGVRGLGLTIALVVSIMFTDATITRAISSTRVNETVQGLFNFPIWPVRWTIVVGFVMLSLVLLGKAVTCLLTFVFGGDDIAKPIVKVEADL